MKHTKGQLFPALHKPVFTALALATCLAAGHYSTASGAPGDGGTGGYHVRVAEGLPQDAADHLKSDLEKAGYTQVVAKEKDGKFEVAVGGASSDEQARSLVNDLKKNGFTPGDVESPESNGSSGSATGSTSQVYRVLVAEFPDHAQADEASKSLRDEGFTNVDIVEKDGRFQLMLGTFNREDEAKNLLSDVHKAGFSIAQVTTQERLTPDANGTAKPLSLPADANLNPEQKKQTEDALKIADKIGRGEASANEVRDLKETIRQLSENQQKILNQVENQRTTERETQQKIYNAYREFDSMVSTRQFDKAQEQLDKVRKLDPAETFLPSKVHRLEAARNEASGKSNPAVASTGSKVDPEKIQKLLNDGRALEAAGKTGDAKMKYQEVLSLDPTNSEAKSRNVEIARKSQAESGVAAAESPLQNKKNLMYLGGGLLALIIVILTWLKLRGRKEEALAPSSAGMSGAETFIDPLAGGGLSAGNPSYDTSLSSGRSGGGASYDPFQSSAAEMPESATGGLSGAAMAGGSLSAMTAFPTDDDDKNATPIPVKTPTPVPSIPESDSVSIEGFGSPTPASALASIPAPAEPALPMPSSPGSETFDLAAMGSETSGPSIPTPLPNETPIPPISMPEAPVLPLSDEVNIDELLKGTFPAAKKGATANPSDDVPTFVPDLGSPSQGIEPIPSRPQSVSNSTPAGGLEIPLPSFDMPGAEPATSDDAPVETAPLSANGAIFSENFDSMETGSQPSDWVGNYDNATLTVVDESPNGEGKSLRFEKTTGNGSASYHCRFPPATGHVTAEFDIRCDDKNKYLLGIYLEKDEDFKQSVHTIIHRLDARTPPAIRIQGEPVPYELGTWFHIRFQLDLFKGTVTSFVNEKEVVRDLKLPSAPSSVNTLSIRDNLATTGVLYIDNIRIAQA